MYCLEEESWATEGRSGATVEGWQQTDTVRSDSGRITRRIPERSRRSPRGRDHCTPLRICQSAQDGSTSLSPDGKWTGSGSSTQISRKSGRKSPVSVRNPVKTQKVPLLRGLILINQRFSPGQIFEVFPLKLEIFG